MKTFKDWSNHFIQKREIGLDEDNIDLNFLDYNLENKPIESDLILRNFNHFCKWSNIGGYVVVEIGRMQRIDSIDIDDFVDTLRHIDCLKITYYPLSKNTYQVYLLIGLL